VCPWASLRDTVLLSMHSRICVTDSLPSFLSQLQSIVIPKRQNIKH
jgi:hypothetical protein